MNKVLVIAEVFFPDRVGGAGKHAFHTARALVEAGNEVTVVTRMTNDLPPEEIIRGIHIFRINWSKYQAWLRPFLFYRDLLQTLKSLNSKKEFSLIVFNQPFSALPVIFCPAAKPIPKIYNFHSSWADEFEIKNFLKHAPYLPVAIFKRIIFLPVISLMRMIEKKVILESDRVVTLSRYMKERTGHLYDTPESKIKIIPAGVDTRVFKPVENSERESLRRQAGIRQESCVLFTARNLVPRMGLDNLIKAFALLSRELADVELFIAGSGFMERKLKALAANSRLAEKVHFLGVLSEEALVKYYQLSDIFILPTQFLEGFGIVTIEAMACGLPVLGTPVGGTIEILEKFDRNLLFDGKRHQQIFEKTFDFIKNSKDRHSLSLRCRQFIIENYSLSKFYAEINKFYLDTVERLNKVRQTRYSANKTAKIKVLHIHTLPLVSGSGLNTFLSMLLLDKEKYEAELACGAGGDLIKLVEDGAMKVRPLKHMLREINPLEDILAFFELMALLKKYQYNIVHTHNSKAGILGRIAGKLSGTPVVIHTLHSCVFRYANLSGLKRRFYLYLEKFCALITDKLISISEPLKEEFINSGIGKPGDYVTIYSGIKIEGFRKKYDIISKKEELNIAKDNLIVGTVSRLAQGKGHRELLYAAKKVLIKLNKVTFLIVGDGPLKKELESLTKELRIDKNVLFSGARSDIEEITSLFDLAVLPSHYEGMGRVLLEAQAAGKPVVACSVGGMKEIVKDGQTGILISPGNIEELYSAIYRLLSDEAWRKNMGDEAAQWVGARFSAETMAKKIENLYEEVLRDKKRDV